MYKYTNFSSFIVFGNYKRLAPPMLYSTSQVLRAGHVEGGHSSAVYGTVVASVYQVVWRSTHVFVYSVVRDSSVTVVPLYSEWGL